MSFRALVTSGPASDGGTSTIRLLEEDALPAGDTTIDIEWAGLNYKDGLCLLGQGGIVRSWPHVAGIDFAGRVRSSDDPRYTAGDAVVLTGWRVGENHWGGFAERARVKADWLVPLPDGVSARDAMVIGTAGLTAMLAINRLESEGISPAKGDILVTGAAGGVGSIAVTLLHSLGYSVTALSGRPEHAPMLQTLGAKAVIDRTEFLAQPEKPLESARWAAAIDCVGGEVLGKLLRQIAYGGSVASLGNAAGITLATNVLPFILRGVNLLGIDSVLQPYDARVAAWSRLAEHFDFATYSRNISEARLEDLPALARQILDGQVRGRVVVDPRR